MNILYDDTRSYNQSIQWYFIQNIENTSLKSITSCSGYEWALADYPFGYKFATPTC